MEKGDRMTFYEWKMSDNCPVCGEEVKPNMMMEHAEKHKPMGALIFLKRVLYFTIDHGSKER